MRVVRDLVATAFLFVFVMPRAKEFLRPIWQTLMAFLTRPRYRACRNFLNRLHPDVLHVFTPDTGAALMIRASHNLNIPVLYHELGTPYHLPILDGWYRRLKKVLPLCTEVAALSPRLATAWSIRFPFLRTISVLPLIAQRSQTFNLSSPAAGRSEIVFGFAGRVEEGKGPLILLDALGRLNTERRLAIARIAGVGAQLAEAKARARELALDGTCEFVGVYSEPLGRSAFMNSLDVFVLPSLAEGTPNSIVEAMACGKPIIASDVGGVADMMGNDAGILVAPGDVHTLADAMRRLAQDRELREQMGRSAQERYRTLFAPAAVFPLLVETYERVMRNGAQTSAASGNGHFHPWRDFMHRKATSVSVRGGSDLDRRWSTGSGQSSVISVVGGLLLGGQQLISWICENW
jgi:glycosyltransferase involved in cell wall biosynthesis